jgi:hypothetical protein
MSASGGVPTYLLKAFPTDSDPCQGKTEIALSMTFLPAHAGGRTLETRSSLLDEEYEQNRPTMIEPSLCWQREAAARDPVSARRSGCRCERTNRRDTARLLEAENVAQILASA